ncbi:MAG: signal peptide peptidase SppA [Pseudomonadota bacterium]
MHLLLLLLIFGAVVAAMSSSVPDLPGRAALIVSPQGYLVEELEGDPVTRAFAELRGEPLLQTRVRDIERALELAGDDDAIEAVVLDLDGLFGGGLTKLDAVARAVSEFRASGKPVYATGVFLSQQAYYIAAHADEIWLNPEGGLLFEGYGRYANYYAEAIDKLDIDWNVFRVGSYKSFAEPFMRNDMSAEDREATTAWLGDLWDSYREQVAAARGIDAAVIDRFAGELHTMLGDDGAGFAELARSEALVDELLPRSEVTARMRELVGEGPDDSLSYNSVAMERYLEAKELLGAVTNGSERKVAVVVASGPVVPGSAPAGQIGGDSTAELIRRAAADDDVAALVLRIDSGGGSVVAADLIVQQLNAFRASGRPVVASMSSVAASAGYWMAAPADRIFALPTTITGSIGVVAMIPTFEDSLARLGITTDGVGTTPLAGQFRPDRSLNEEARALVQRYVEYDYARFIGEVAQYRGMELSAVNDVAQGRVWSGQDALPLGLIDEFGDLSAAVEAAAALAELGEDYRVDYVEPPLSPLAEIVLGLTGAAAHLNAGGAIAPRSAAERLLNGIGNQLEALARFRDPRGIYSVCFCEIR